MVSLAFQQEGNWFWQSIQTTISLRTELFFNNNFLLDNHACEIALITSPFTRCPALIEIPVIPNNWAKVLNVKSNVTYMNAFCFYYSMEPAIVVCLVIAFIFWLIRVARIVIHFFKLLEIRASYKNALRISEVSKV